MIATIHGFPSGEVQPLLKYLVIDCVDADKQSKPQLWNCILGAATI